MTARDDAADRAAGDEHQRFARYQQELAQVREEDEAELVRAVLGDEDRAMARASVVGHLERRATELLTDPRFPEWADSMTRVIAECAFLARRLREWTLLRSIVTDDTWTAVDVVSASDWFQREAARSATSPAALALLADGGRTRRVRNAARRRMTSSAPDGAHSVPGS